MKSGPTAIANHSWFRKTNWPGLYAGTVEADFKPKISNAFDASNFDDYENVPIHGVEANLTEQYECFPFFKK